MNLIPFVQEQLCQVAPVLTRNAGYDCPFHGDPLLRFSVLLLVIRQVLPSPDRISPCLIGAIPFDSFLKAIRKRNGRFPAEVPLDFRAVDRIAAVMPGPIGYVANERLSFADRFQERMCKLQVGSLAAASDVVNLTSFSFEPNLVNRRAMVEHMNPIADI